MQAISHSIGISNNVQSASIAGLNGRITFPSTNGPGQQHARTEPNFIFENVDPANLDGEDDSDGDLSPSGHCQGMGQGLGHSGTTSSLKPGKKTKGRVKIKMEFIENKLRRYTTFSKRKTGIMKKAYELSTLTGTQVMLLVASETGHVYTFATRKLQPMITSESGKALIQTCLNSPDPPPGVSGHMSLEQRMNPTGFEETGFTYCVADEDSKMMTEWNLNGMEDRSEALMSPPSHTSPPNTEPTPAHTARPSVQPNVATVVNSANVLAASQPVAAHSSSGAADNVTIKVANIPVQFPGFIFQTSGGQSVAIPASQLSLATQPHTSQPHTTYRTAAGTVLTSMANQTASGESTSAVTTPSFSILSGSGGTAVTPSPIIMYQTPQGVVYAAPTTATPVGTERTIFNFQQPATAISLPQHDTGSGQQIITIPVSLASAQQVLQLTTVPASESLRPAVKSEGQATLAKKARK